VFHFASERPADDDPIREELEQLGAKLVQANRSKDSSRVKNYHLKAQAIVEAEWAEIIYLVSPTNDQFSWRH
jgi:alpha 1,2-mannosyltransferase